jgi:predicted membrane protein
VDVGVLLWGLLFSSIGLGFFLYGRKQRAVVPLVCGLVLMIYPYFIPNVIALVAIGVVLIAVPYFFKS